MCTDPAISYTLQPPVKCHCLLLNEPPGAFSACPSTTAWTHTAPSSSRPSRPSSEGVSREPLMVEVNLLRQVCRNHKMVACLPATPGSLPTAITSESSPGLSPEPSFLLGFLLPERNLRLSASSSPLSARIQMRHFGVSWGVNPKLSDPQGGVINLPHQLCLRELILLKC